MKIIEIIDVDAGFPKARSALVNNYISQIDCEHSRSVSVTGKKKTTYLFNICMFNNHHHHQTVTIIIP